MKRDRIQDLRHSEEKIYEAIELCINDTSVNINVGLFIGPIECDILVVSDPGKEGEALFTYERIDWKNLVLDGLPDMDAINNVASGYIL